MELTVKQALMECAEHYGANGVCWDDPANLKALNAARRLIYEQGDFEGTTGWFVANPKKGFFSMPLSFQGVRHVYECDKDIEIIESPSMILDCDTARRCCSGRVSIHVSREPVRRPYTNHPGCGFSIRMNSSSDDDKKKVVNMTLVTSNNRTVRRSVEMNGEKPVRVNGLFNDIISIVKDDGFTGFVTLYAITETVDCFVMVEIPPIINIPKVWRYKIGGGCRAKQVACYGKKLPLPLKHHDDEMDITSVTALKFAYQAMNAISDKDRKAFTELIQLVRGSLSLASQSLFEGNASEDIGENFSSLIIP